MRSDPKFGAHNPIKPLSTTKHIKCDDIIMTIDLTELDLTEYDPFGIFHFRGGKEHATLSISLKWAIFDQRRRVAELKPFADDCAKLHSVALAAVVLIAQGTPQPETTRRPSWLRLARHASKFYGFSVLSRDPRGPNIRAKACSLRACAPQGRLPRPTMHLSRPATHSSRRVSARASRSRISPSSAR